MHRELASDAVKLAPPIAATSLELWGISLADWLVLITIIYTLLMAAMLIRKFLFSRRLGDRDPVCAEDCPVARRLVDERDSAKRIKPC